MFKFIINFVFNFYLIKFIFYSKLLSFKHISVQKLIGSKCTVQVEYIFIVLMFLDSGQPKMSYFISCNDIKTLL